MRCAFWLLIFLTCCLNSFAQADFPPPAVLQKIKAYRTTGPIKLDGILDEPDWQNAPAISGFKQVEPKQGESARFDTEVKILFDEKNLYIGFFAKDTMGKEGIRTNDLTRDFSFDDNDLVGIAIDAYNTRRDAIAFQVTPRGNLRDLRSFDDNIFDIDWNGLWDAKTTITPKGWYCEIAIPFSTLAYPANAPADSVSWGINFIRIHRRSNEISAFPGFPRSFDTYRMTYVAALTGLQPPKQDLNVRVDPYVVTENNRLKTDQSDKNSVAVKEGGDIRWGNTSHSTVDLTFNTDFAQADADQQIINLTRFSISLPEKRQFFLENAGLFNAGDNANLLPYFSRNIGLNANGQPIPIIAGLRYTDRTDARSVGVLYTLQNSDAATPVTQFGVFRYIKNYNKQDNFGVLVTEKATDTTNNTVIGFTGINRIGNFLRITYLWSNSFDEKSGPESYNETGTGSNLNIDYTNDVITSNTNHTLVSQRYIPGIGFVSQGNLLINTSSFFYSLRPKWKPAFIRVFQPGIWVNFAERASDLSLEERELSLYLVYATFTDGSLVTVDYRNFKENLTEDFDLVNLDVAKGQYNFNRLYLNYTSDQSKKIAVNLTLENGGYYNGKLFAATSGLTVAPLPNIFFIANYQFNALRGTGINKGSENTNLFTGTLRLALNKNVQLSSFYQYDSVLKVGGVNERFSWEYRPLSYIYLVFNSNKDNLQNQLSQQSIFKISYLKQF